MPTSATNVMQNAVCLIVRKHSVGTRRSISTDRITVNAEKHRVGASKSLLQSPEIDAISSLDGYARKWLYAHSTANELIASGIYLVKHTAIPIVEEYMNNWRTQREDLIDKLCARYPQIVIQDRDELHGEDGEFNPDDYPGVRIVNGKLQVSKDALRNEFSLDWDFKSFQTPESLKTSVSAEFYEKAQQKEQARVANMADEVIFGIREEAKNVISHLLDRLTPEPDGSQKVLHKTAVDKVTDFLDIFESCKNLGGDTGLSELVKKLKPTMNGVTKDMLKAQEPLREAVAKDLEAAKKQLDSMLIDKPKRIFRFDEVA